MRPDIHRLSDASIRTADGWAPARLPEGRPRASLSLPALRRAVVDRRDPSGLIDADFAVRSTARVLHLARLEPQWRKSGGQGTQLPAPRGEPEPS